MDPIYQNPSFIHSTGASDEKQSQYRGNRTGVQEKRKHSSKWTKILLIGLTVSLVCALGGLVFLGILYVKVSVQLSAQETNAKIIARELGDLTVNYTRVKENLHINEIKTTQLVANFSRVKQQSFCPAQSVNSKSSWTDFQGKLYFFSNDALTWSSSHVFCVSEGANLVTISSQEEQKFLHSKVSGRFWIGLTDLETEGRWVWVNCQTLQETGVQFWYQRRNQESEPDNWKQEDPSGENCAIVTNEHAFSNSWNDVSCKKKFKFICEKRKAMSEPKFGFT